MKLSTKSKQRLWKFSPALFNQLSRPKTNTEFSIGIISGVGMNTLSQSCGQATPVLTRDSVTDVPAVFVADPFIIRQHATWYMFFEIMSRLDYDGCIGYAESRDGKDWTYGSVVLEEPFHLAYPYVFRHAGDTYMVPDSIGNGVRLYRAASFPTGWEYVTTLVNNNSLCDNTLFQHDGLWWVFCCELVDGRDYLRIYFADSLLGQWHEHAAGRIESPIDQRPAGRTIEVEGQLYRFVQNQEGEYAESVTIRRIDKLTTTQFVEAEVDAYPSPLLSGSGQDWNADGMHHIDLCFTDGKSYLGSVDGVRRS